MGNGTGSDAGERGDSEPPAGWDAEHVAAHESFMRHKLKSGSTLREDTPSDRETGVVPRGVGRQQHRPPRGQTRRGRRRRVHHLGRLRGEPRELHSRATQDQVQVPARRPRRSPQVALLHRADNTYNRRAMAVATPASRKVPPSREGITQPCCRRQVPSLWATSPIGSCERSASRSLPALAQLAGSRGGEVQCIGLVFDVADLMLDLPIERVLSAAIEAFLAEHGIDIWQKPRQAHVPLRADHSGPAPHPHPRPRPRRR